MTHTIVIEVYIKPSFLNDTPAPLNILNSTMADDNNMPDMLSKCAACGKGGGELKTCTACKLVKYCNATCQRAHRTMHKKECKKRAAELHDESLFKQPPPRCECPICLLVLPLDQDQRTYHSCCGKTLCKGCIYAFYTESGGEYERLNCPLCRTPAPLSESEAVERNKKRVDADDAAAMHELGILYMDGEKGFPQDRSKAMELWFRAGELGCAMAYNNIGTAYYSGEGVEKDVKKAKYYMELAAMGGDANARLKVGYLEEIEGNIDRSAKHHMIAAATGYDDSLDKIRTFFMHGCATKEDFEKALRAHKESADEMKSDQREAAVAFLASGVSVRITAAAAGGQVVGMY